MTEERRGGHAWTVIKANWPQITMAVVAFSLIAKLYFDVQFMWQHVNPEAIAAWKEQQARASARVEQTNDISNRRWCMMKMTFEGADLHKVMSCLD